MRYPLATWRLLLESHPGPGARNMAIDEALLRAVVAGTAPPTLRLYAWSPPTLTLGRGQPYADADVAALRRDGIELVRRMTGGTAVLNRDELTYSVVATDTEPRFAGSIAESYRGIGEALLCALKRLGLPEPKTQRPVTDRGLRAERAQEGAELHRSRGRTPVCFEIPSDYEIIVGGRKLVGNSQMRVRGGILQHGSLPLAGDIADISAYLMERPDVARIRSLALTLFDGLGRAVSWKEAAESIIGSFCEVLDLALLPGPLTLDEQHDVETLLAEKYDSLAWTMRL